MCGLRAMVFCPLMVALELREISGNRPAFNRFRPVRTEFDARHEPAIACDANCVNFPLDGNGGAYQLVRKGIKRGVLL